MFRHQIRSAGVYLCRLKGAPCSAVKSQIYRNSRRALFTAFRPWTSSPFLSARRFNFPVTPSHFFCHKPAVGFSATMPEKKAFSRLPVDVVPSNYDVKLQPNLSTFTFEGEESIDVEVFSVSKTKLSARMHICYSIVLRDPKYCTSTTQQSYRNNVIWSLLYQNDVATSFRHNRDVIASCVLGRHINLRLGAHICNKAGWF